MGLSDILKPKEQAESLDTSTSQNSLSSDLATESLLTERLGQLAPENNERDSLLLSSLEVDVSIQQDFRIARQLSEPVIERVSLLIGAEYSEAVKHQSEQLLKVGTELGKFT